MFESEVRKIARMNHARVKLEAEVSDAHRWGLDEDVEAMSLQVIHLAHRVAAIRHGVKRRGGTLPPDVERVASECHTVWQARHEFPPEQAN